MCVLVAQLCLTLCDPMVHSLPGSSVHGILQARILKWVAIAFSRGWSQSRDGIQVCRIAGRLFTIWSTRDILMYYFSTYVLYTLCTITRNNIKSLLQWKKWWMKGKLDTLKRERKKKWHDEIEIQVRWSGILTPHWVLIGECTSFLVVLQGLILLYIFWEQKIGSIVLYVLHRL